MSGKLHSRITKPISDRARLTRPAGGWFTPLAKALGKAQADSVLTDSTGRRARLRAKSHFAIRRKRRSGWPRPALVIRGQPSAFEAVRTGQDWTPVRP